MYKLEKFLGGRFERIQNILDSERNQMNSYVNLIGSANYAFPSVLQALNTPFNLNPSEGKRGHRYFPLCQNIDELENISENLLCKLFECDYYTNIEPYSGTQANQIVYQSILKQGDTVLAMSSKAGGHVSHHHYLNTFCNVINYSVDDNDLLDYNEIQAICVKEKPKLVIAGASSYPRAINYEKLYKICKKSGSYLLADISHTAIYIMSRNHPSPFPFADFVTFTTHKTTRGIRGGIVMCKKEFSCKLEKAVFPIVQGAPKYNEILAKAIMLEELADMNIQRYVDKILKISSCFVDVFKENGLKLYTNGTDSHLILIDLRNSNITGKDCEEILEKEYILTNRNQLPKDTRSAYITSGLRIGVLTLATLDMEEIDYKRIAHLIADSIIKQRVLNKDLCHSIINKYEIVK